MVNSTKDLPLGWNHLDLMLSDDEGDDDSVSWELDRDLVEIEHQQTLQALEPPSAPGEEQVFDEESQAHAVGVVLPSSTPRLSNSLSVDIPESTLVSPSYLYQGEYPVPPPQREWSAVKRLLEEHQRSGVIPQDGYIDIELDKFVVYTQPYAPGRVDYPKAYYPAELRPLQHLSTKQNNDSLFFDGVLSVANCRIHVRQVSFNELPIGKYGIENPTVGSDIWIRSDLNAKRLSRGHKDICYRLKNPAKEYKRFHSGFLWIADLAKHVVDYLEEAHEENRDVNFQDFRSDFSTWLSQKHEGSLAFSRWRKQYPGTDFGFAVNANVQFVWKEANGILGEVARSFRLWKEILHFTAFPSITASESTSSTQSNTIPKTIVTPYISHPQHREIAHRTSKALKLELCAKIHTAQQPFNMKRPISGIQVGDVVSILPDAGIQVSIKRKRVLWNNQDDKLWYGMIQEVHHTQAGIVFDVTWLYQPNDTPCGQMVYPWNNEIFFSDHCTCHESPGERERLSKIKEEEVLSTHSVDWDGSQDTDNDFFCRLTYLTAEHCWETFSPAHRRCSFFHREEETSFEYQLGDTVLVTSQEEQAEVVELTVLPNSVGLATFRRLPSRQHYESQMPPNELLYSDEEVSYKVTQIAGRCLVRIFRPGELIAPPYDRGGAGNAFYITNALQCGRVCPLEDTEFSLRQAFDPSKSFPKLRGVDLFCGGGNFGRGLEEAGAITMDWCNDMNAKAVHTYVANAGNTVAPFTGPIEELQKLALLGSFSDNVPEIGQVDFVSGGSPCPGFSRLTSDKTKPKQLKNQSLVAAFASFIDIYRPKYGLLENVEGIVQPETKKKEDVFRQLICAIVGLGYQTRCFLLDSWSHGAPQTRTRVFLCFAAPGLKLPKVPRHSHSHYKARQLKLDSRYKARELKLGKLSNGQFMIERQVSVPTALKFVSAAAATADLPDIKDGKPDFCAEFPDHRVACGVTKNLRTQMSIIPFHPYAMDFLLSWRDGKGTMTKAERQCFPDRGRRVNKGSRAFGRVKPSDPMHTITTKSQPSDSSIGKILHWNQNRPLTVMEARRAQGFRDNDIILGNPVDQYQTIGNSVSREVSIALGVSFREAWLGSLVDGEELDPIVWRLPAQSMNEAVEDYAMSPGTPALAESSRGTPASKSPRPLPKRKFGSSLGIESVVSKLMKSSRAQMASEGRVKSDKQYEPAGSASALTSTSSSVVASFSSPAPASTVASVSSRSDVEVIELD
ncbi:Putative BAH domain, C-5 cytosine methyltransferase, DNA methylase, C-5 cytosine-specific, active [Colletotrichum destructivum]|uniref:Cytosine-specific methyltransferase n=1 Tax=Colletotrichum destructivum TaxID=34406 RepID=A0AAX4I5E4_9PEZI|nr:Putative BAH domain, C-5 cytosine methyltransferase, DNA methylase, C-5 cytosine-specific, active [Colletotrichum destructivum]